MKKKLKAVIIGSGNVATHLSLAFSDHLDFIQCYSPTLSHAKKLASKLSCAGVSEISDIRSDAEIFLICISDDAIKKLGTKLSLPGKLCIHTSGSVNMSVLDKISSRNAVLYPLQTFNSKRKIDISKVPFFIEASSREDEKLLSTMVRKIGAKSFLTDSESRTILHLSAVYACNFANHMWSLAEMLCKKNNLPKKILNPLIEETFLKATELGPFQAQTGPAKRQDLKVIEKHLKILSGDKNLQKVYSVISKSIINLHHSK